MEGKTLWNGVTSAPTPAGSSCTNVPRAASKTPCSKKKMMEPRKTMMRKMTSQTSASAKALAASVRVSTWKASLRDELRTICSTRATRSTRSTLVLDRPPPRPSAT